MTAALWYAIRWLVEALVIAGALTVIVVLLVMMVAS